MISRIDNSSKLLSENLKENQQHPRYSILSRLCCSKNSINSDTPLIRFCSMRRTRNTVSWLRCWHGLNYLLVKGTWKEQVSILAFMVKMTLFWLKSRRLIWWKIFLMMMILAVYLKVSVVPISSERWWRRDPEGAGDQKMKLIQNISGNREVSKICMIIWFSHGQMKSCYRSL